MIYFIYLEFTILNIFLIPRLYIYSSRKNQRILRKINARRRKSLSSQGPVGGQKSITRRRSWSLSPKRAGKDKTHRMKAELVTLLKGPVGGQTRITRRRKWSLSSERAGGGQNTSHEGGAGHYPPSVRWQTITHRKKTEPVTLPRARGGGQKSIARRRTWSLSLPERAKADKQSSHEEGGAGHSPPSARG
jgi:hypothetical protein